MSNAIEIRVEGLEEARAALEKIIREDRRAIPEALEVIGQVWETEVRRLAPLLTGRLRRSYRYEVGRGRALYVEMASNVVYAPYQEFGTSRGPGTPHLRPGTERTIPQVPKAIAEGISRRRGGRIASIGGSGRGRLGSAISRMGAL